MDHDFQYNLDNFDHIDGSKLVRFCGDCVGRDLSYFSSKKEVRQMKIVVRKVEKVKTTQIYFSAH